MPSSCNWISPDWPAPLNVKALTTLRWGGRSQKPFDSFNLALHVNDDPAAVTENRRILQKSAQLPSEPLWLAQVHGTKTIEAGEYATLSSPPEADASVAFQKNQICAVLTADCLPLLLCDQKGTRVSAVHAGWRGLAAGVLESALETLDCDPRSILVWLGPAIGSKAFEVGEEVLAAFNKPEEQVAFIATPKGTWHADLYHLATLRLNRLGVHQIFGGGLCTYYDSDSFFSYRRDQKTGRMASLIWLEP